MGTPYSSGEVLEVVAIRDVSDGGVTDSPGFGESDSPARGKVHLVTLDDQGRLGVIEFGVGVLLPTMPWSTPVAVVHGLLVGRFGDPSEIGEPVVRVVPIDVVTLVSPPSFSEEGF